MSTSEPGAGDSAVGWADAPSSSNAGMRKMDLECIWLVGFRVNLDLCLCSSKTEY